MVEDPFQRRLDEINREMLDILRVDRSETATQKQTNQYIDPHDAVPTLYAAKGMMGDIGTGFSEQQTRRDVKDAVSREMQGFEERMKQLVRHEWDLRVAELDTILRSRFLDLRNASDQVSKAVVEVSESVEQRISAVESKLEAAVADNRRQFIALDKEVKNATRALRQLQDSREFLPSGSPFAAENDQRMDALLQRHNTVIERALTHVDKKLEEARNEQETNTRELKRLVQRELDSVARDVCNLQGATENSIASTERILGELQEFAEEMVSHRSTVRSCRTEVSQLEQLVRQVQQSSEVSGSAPGSTTKQQWNAIQQEMFALKECIAFISKELENLQSSSAQNHLTAAVSRKGNHHHHHHSHSLHLQEAALDSGRPPYINSNRQTPTKNNHNAGRGGGGFVDGGSFNASGTYRTVPDSDSEEERESRKLARSELD